MKNPAVQLPTYSLTEWQSRELKDCSLSEEDRPLTTRLASEAESRLAVDEMRDGLRIASRSWVGVVRFHNFELQVVPKLAGGNLGLVELIDYAKGLDALDRHPSLRTLEGSGTCLFDLMALLLAEACEGVLRGGLLSDYRQFEDALPVVRGRLMIERQVLKRFGRIDRLECRYDEHLNDIVENRILLAALSLCAGRVRHPSVALRVRRLHAIFSEVCSVHDLDLRQVRTSLVYDRMNEHYREPHGLAWLILDGLGVEDIYAAGSLASFAFLLDMNRLFESFVNRWLRQVLVGSEFQMISQQRDRTILWNAELARPYASIIPDLLVGRRTTPGVFLPVDAKYKLYDQRSLATSDIYQTFLYAYAYGEQHAVLPTALVLYPASSPDGAEIRLHIRRSGGATSAQLRAVPIHIPTALLEAHSKQSGATKNRLASLIAAAFIAPDH